MSDRSLARHLPVAITLVVALMLSMMPLPGVLDILRPDWVALVIVFWAMSLPSRYGVGVAWIAGIVLDVSHGTLLGQHALALSVITYITVKFNLLMRVFPLLQLTATVFALNTLYQFLLFWINGVAGISVPPSTYWGPVISGALIWPLLFTFLSGLRYRAQTRH